MHIDVAEFLNALPTSIVIVAIALVLIAIATKIGGPYHDPSDTAEGF